MKKMISLTLALILSLCLLSACGDKPTSAPLTLNATVEGSIFGGKNDHSISLSASFDFGWLTARDNPTYDPALAQFCALLSADSYYRSKDVASNRQNRVLLSDTDAADYTTSTLLSRFGFSEVEHYESYLYATDPTDSNDSVTLTLAHATVDGECDVFVIVARGCFSAQEWKSAFDPGCDDALYSDLTGAHPEWTNKAHFKGVDVAANRALARIEAFREENGDENLPDRLLITGHSRGGAIANILGAHYEDDPLVTSCTYTFNAPGVTLTADADQYVTIFNVFDTGDFFTDPFPFGAGTYARYGRDLSLSVAENRDLRLAIAELKECDDYLCVPADIALSYRTLFAERFPDRDRLCDPDTLTRVFETEEEALLSRNGCLAVIDPATGLGLGDLCRVTEITACDGGFSYTLEYCDAALLRTYAMILAYGEKAYTPAAELFDGDEAGLGIADILLAHASEINGGHLLVNSYVLAGFVQ